MFDCETARVAGRVLTCVVSSGAFLQEPFTFPSYHRKMMEPYDYYNFGQNYVRPLLDFR